MSTQPQAATQPVVLRQGGAVLVPVVVWLFALLAVGDAVVEGTASYVVHVVALMAAISLATWLVLASPCLVVEPAGLRIVNPLRVHRVPFEVLEGVRVRGLTQVTARQEGGDSTTITSWNAPGMARRAGTEPQPDAVEVVVERRRSAWERGVRDRGAPATVDAALVPVLATTWRWQPALALGVLVLANISIWLRWVS